MAFCPNCGTSNTEQAERCVACGHELIVPKQKAKFKGTIMMSGIKAPASQPDEPSAPPPPSVPPPVVDAPVAELAPAPSRNLNYQKTMLGQPPIALPKQPEAKPATADLGTMPTMQGQTPVQLPGETSSPSSVAPPAGSSTRELQPDLAYTNPQGGLRARNTPPESTPIASLPTPSQPSSGGYTGGGTYSGSTYSGATRPGAPGPRRATMGGAYESTMPPAAPTNPAKVIAVGCGVVLALLLVVGGALWFAFGDKLRALFGGESEASAAEAAAWHASIAQSLTRVNELCASDCAQAGVFFHPLKQAALLGEARALTAERVAKLNDPNNASAMMLDHTEDSAVATQLGLDPQQCARVTAGSAKVISCSVPDPSGKPSVLRIVQLSGVGTL